MSTLYTCPITGKMRRDYNAPLINVEESKTFYKEEALRFKRTADYKAFLTRSLKTEREFYRDIKAAVAKDGWHQGDIYRSIHVVQQGRLVDWLAKHRQKF